MNHDYESAVYDRYPQLVYDKAELTVPVYYAALWPTQYAEEEAARRQKEAEDRRAAEEKAKQAKCQKRFATGEKPKRSG
ncbi:MAG: hypothetical protein R2838_11905 [Caldilineaceae bacterium]